MSGLTIDWGNLSWSFTNGDLISALLGILALFGAGYGVGFWTSTITQPERKQLKDAERQTKISDRERDKAKASLAKLSSENRRYQSLRDSLLGSDTDLWNPHPPEPYDGYDRDVLSTDLNVVTVMNLKGGVGKTTLATNLAAYFSTHLGKRTLLVDLDFQGSATSSLLNLTEFTDNLDARIENLFGSTTGRAHHGDVIMPVVHPKFASTRFELAACGYPFSRIENQKLIAWLMRELAFDPRYILAQFLFSPAVRSRFDTVVIDAPPRLSLGAINALTASRTLVIPTLPDRMSTEAVRNFVGNAATLRRLLNPALQNALVVLNGTRQSNQLVGFEAQVRQELEGALEDWDGIGKVLDTIVPRRSAFGNALSQRSLALFENDANTPKTSEILSSFGAEVAEHMGIV